MKHRFLGCLVAIALATVLAVPAQAQLTGYAQDFEGLNQADGGALAGDGWGVFGNVFSPDGLTYFYGYGVFPAPNGGAGFSAVAAGEGGFEQGVQQLSIYNDYNNGDHGNGFLIEANVFQEQIVGAGDVGETWTFKFDAKAGNINDPGFTCDPPCQSCPCSTTAIAFIKTLDPNSGWGLSNFITLDTTALPTAWGTYELSITIDGSLAPGGTGPAGHILQIGYASTATFFQPSGNFYDNITFGSCGNGTTEGGEECDDGNAEAGDGCRPDCTAEVCGDGIQDAGEDCDDGNTNGGDTCSSTCTTLEAIPTVSEWGLIIMGLLFLSLGTVVLRRNQSVLAGAGTSSMSFGDRQTLFVPGLFVKLLAATAGLALFGLAGAQWLGLDPTQVDVVGSLLCVPIVAYVVHLWMMKR